MNLISPELITSLFFILNPIGNIPIFFTILKSYSAKERAQIILQECLLGLATLLLFIFGGNKFLSVLGLSTDAVRGAGAVLLFIIALHLNFPKPEGVGALLGLAPGKRPFLTPLAIPMFVGAGSISTVIVFSNTLPLSTCLASVSLCWAVSTLLLLIGAHYAEWCCQKTISVVEKIVGLVLLMISLEMGFAVVRSVLGC